MRRVTSHDLKNLYEPAPRELYDGVHAVLARLPERRQKKMKKKMRTGLILAAALLLLLSAAGIAANQMRLFSTLTNSAVPIMPLEGAEKLVQTDLGSVENEWATVTVEQAAYDGQGVNVLARITPKAPEECALFNSWLMNFSEDLYDIEKMPVRFPQGGEVWEQDGKVIEVVNDRENQSRTLTVDGATVAIPDSREAAEAAELPVYLEDDELYFADQWERRVTGRKDGKRIVGFDMGLSSASDEAVEAGLDNGMASTAEEQQDGSVLVWFDAIAEQPLSGELEMKLTVLIWPNGEEDPSGELKDEIVFALKKCEDERVARYVPEDGGEIGDHVRVREVSVRYTPVRAYLTVDFDYDQRPEEEMGIWFHVYDAQGNPINTGSGWETGPEDAAALGFHRQQGEMQSFDEIPDVIVLEAKPVDLAPLGTCACRLVKEE